VIRNGENDFHAVVIQNVDTLETVVKGNALDRTNVQAAVNLLGNESLREILIDFFTVGGGVATL